MRWMIFGFHWSGRVPPCLYLAGITVKVQTPGGTIQIESNVTDIEVLVDNEKVVTITDPADQKKLRVEVKPGAKALTVPKDGFEADVTEFSLKTVKGPIKVTFVPVKQAAASGDPRLDLERPIRAAIRYRPLWSN
jgi:hypothetical protein